MQIVTSDPKVARFGLLSNDPIGLIFIFPSENIKRVGIAKKEHNTKMSKESLNYLNSPKTGAVGSDRNAPVNRQRSRA